MGEERQVARRGGGSVAGCQAQRRRGFLCAPASSPPHRRLAPLFVSLGHTEPCLRRMCAAISGRTARPTAAPALLSIAPAAADPPPPQPLPTNQRPPQHFIPPLTHPFTHPLPTPHSGYKGGSKAYNTTATAASTARPATRGGAAAASPAAGKSRTGFATNCKPVFMAPPEREARRSPQTQTKSDFDAAKASATRGRRG